MSLRSKAAALQMSSMIAMMALASEAGPRQQKEQERDPDPSELKPADKSEDPPPTLAMGPVMPSMTQQEEPTGWGSRAARRRAKRGLR